MGATRTHSESDHVHPSRQAQVPGSSLKPSKRRRRMKQPIHKKQAHTSSINATKKRIRDIKRRLERSEDLPADMRVEYERALAAYLQELSAACEEKTRQKMIKKYHMVRFFERQKATRQLKKLRKRLLEAKSTEEVENIKAQTHVAEVDLNYTQYYPLNERYISLYPQKAPSTGDQPGQDVDVDAATQKPPMWAEVEKRMMDGTLIQLRNRMNPKIVSQDNERTSQSQHPKSKSVSTQSLLKPQVNDTAAEHTDNLPKLKKKSSASRNHHSTGNDVRHAHSGALRDERGGDESDGGFFEE